MHKIKDIVKKLEAASDAYYNSDKTTMTDTQFDELKAMLKDIDPDNPFLKRVGAPAQASSPLAKVKHSIPMGSLDKVDDRDALVAWCNKIGGPFVVQHKVDGNSIGLVYRDGQFKQAITRGDGVIGDDVTHTISRTKIPDKIISHEPCAVRCEAVLYNKDWEQHFSDTSNPRNAVAGLVRRLDGEGAEHIRLVAFELAVNIALDEDEKTTTMQKFGFTVVPSYWVKDAQDVLDAVADIEKDRNANKIPYDIDGAVVKVVDGDRQVELGEKDMIPRWATVIKFAPKGGETVINDVSFQIGSSGAITPVAIVEPVSVGGTTITNVNLCNMDEIARLGVAIGDTVYVIRAGDVIPKITNVVKQGGNRKTIGINNCPECGRTLIKKDAITYCPDPDACPGTQLQRIMNWIGKRDIKFLGDETMKALWNAEKVTCVADLYHITQDQFVIAGVGQAMAKKILAEIEKSRDCSLSDLIGSLSIPMIGRREAAHLIEKGVDTLDKFLNLHKDDLLKFDGYADIKAERVADGLSQFSDTIRAVAKCLNIAKSEAKQPTATGGKLAGMSFCFTGKMSHQRAELQEMAQENGGTAKDGVNAGLTYLVQASADSVSSKSKQAAKYGTKCISEDDFLKMIE